MYIHIYLKDKENVFICAYTYIWLEWITLPKIHSIYSIMALPHLSVILELWLRLYESWGNWLEAQKEVSQGSACFISYNIFHASISENSAADTEQLN